MMNNVSIQVSILQISIDALIYYCVSINKMFSAMDKSFQITFSVEEKPLYSFVAVLDLYSRRLSYHFSLPNDDHTKYSSF